MLPFSSKIIYKNTKITLYNAVQIIEKGAVIYNLNIQYYDELLDYLKSIKNDPNLTYIIVDKLGFCLMNK